MRHGIGIYLHVPFCKHACPYCDFYKVELRDFPARSRLDFPLRCDAELELLLREEPSLAGRPLETIYFGGGTPSTLSPEGTAPLIEAIRARFPSESPPEITLEANPENLTPARCRKWREAGINRLSIGVQSFQARDLSTLERLHEPALIPRVVANAREAGIDNLSLDLMFALPDQTFGEWLKNLEAAVALSPEHLSFYGLTWHERTRFLEMLEAGELRETDEDLQAEMYLRGAALLEEAGYEHYEISNFARPGFRSRHNQRYWRRDDVIALGPGGHSNLGAKRWSNPEDLEHWGDCIDMGRLARIEAEELSEPAAEGERLFTLLRTREGLLRSEDPALHARCGEWLAANPEGEGLLLLDVDRATLSREGWLVSNAIIAALVGR